MNLMVDRNVLWQGIDTVLDVVPSKPALPVLSNILLEAEGQYLSLAATDIDLAIRTKVSASVKKKGSIAVPARTLAEITREWPEAQLNIEVEGDRLNLSGKLGEGERSEGSYTLAGMRPDEFPDMPTSLEGVAIPFGEGLNARVLGDMISKTSFAVSRDDTRPVLNGAFWRIDAKGMEMVATDGSRLAYYRRQLDLKGRIKGGEEAAVIVPPQTLGQMAKLLGHQKEPHRVTLGESRILVEMEDTHLLSRLIEGPYVDYGQVIPRQNDKHLRVAGGQLLPALRRVSILSSSYTRQVRLKVNSTYIELSAASPEIGGEAHEIVPAQYDGEEMEVGYNAQFLMEILRKMEVPEVCFDLSNHVTAALLRPAEQEEGEEYFCLLMPLRPMG